MQETKTKNRSTGLASKAKNSSETLKQKTNGSTQNLAPSTQDSFTQQQRQEEQLSLTLYQPPEAPKQPDLLLHDVVDAGGNKFEVVAFLTQTNTSVPTYMFKRCSAPFDAFYATLAELKEFYAD